MDGWAAVVTSDRCSPSLITRSVLFLQRYRRRKCYSITVCVQKQYCFLEPQQMGCVSLWFMFTLLHVSDAQD